MARVTEIRRTRASVKEYLIRNSEQLLVATRSSRGPNSGSGACNQRGSRTISETGSKPDFHRKMLMARNAGFCQHPAHARAFYRPTQPLSAPLRVRSVAMAAAQGDDLDTMIRYTALADGGYGGTTISGHFANTGQ